LAKLRLPRRAARNQKIAYFLWLRYSDSVLAITDACVAGDLAYIRLSIELSA